MSTQDFVVDIDIGSEDKAWRQFREIVEGEGWKSDDHSVMELTPILSSTRSVVAKDTEGNFLGCVVWNEYDNIAFIGFYLLREKLRGKGIGSVVWKQAIERMPKDYTIGLRAVPEKTEMYRSKDTPFIGPTLNEFNVPWRQILDICSTHSNNRRVKAIRELSPEEFSRFLDFDGKVTGKDRSDFLRRFYLDLPFTAGNVLFSETGEIVAMAGITPTSTKESHMFKLAPIYANCLEDAFTAASSLVEFAGAKDPEALVLFHILSGSRGEKEILPLLLSMGVPTRLTGVTLFSKEIKNPIDTERVYIPNNNSGHYDT